MANLALIPASIVPATTSFLRATCGATIVAGDLVYKDADKLLQLSDANATGQGIVARRVDGMAVSGGAAGQPINYVEKDPSMTIDAAAAIAGTTSGIPYFLSGTAGKMCPAADLASGMRTIFVGVTLPGGKFNFSPAVGGDIPA